MQMTALTPPPSLPNTDTCAREPVHQTKCPSNSADRQTTIAGRAYRWQVTGMRTTWGNLFGWQFDTPSPVAREVSEPDTYGFLDLVQTEDGTGIRGGIGGGPQFRSHATFYVSVEDVEAALQRAEQLGGQRVMGPARSPSGLVVGHFTDPEGTLIGLAGPA